MMAFGCRPCRIRVDDSSEMSCDRMAIRRCCGGNGSNRGAVERKNGCAEVIREVWCVGVALGSCYEGGKGR